MELAELKPILELISISVTILGFPIAIYILYTEKRKERLDRENGTYSTLDDKYMEFLNLCLEHSDLGIYEINNIEDERFSPKQITQRKIIFEILICLFERAFLMYNQESNTIKKRRWFGWEAYMKNWMENEQFRYLWKTWFNSQYDTLFLEYMNSLYFSVENEKSS